MSLEHTAAELIRKHEGFSGFAYRCPAGKLSIGYGRNVDSDGGIGISEDEAAFLLAGDIHRIRNELTRGIRNFLFLDEIRQAVLIDMCYNLGIGRFLAFKKMIRAVEGSDFPQASREMLDSKWAKQVGGRAEELASLMKGEKGNGPGTHT